MKVKFIGATETVTGSKHLLITESGKQILLDCGLFQGEGKETDEMNEHLGVDPEKIQAVILSHGHIDHCGSLPLLVKQGFNGKIYSTEATFDVCSILLLDSAHIHESDAAYRSKQNRKKGLAPVKPLYTIEDAEKALGFFEPVPFDTDTKLNSELSFYFSENGHIVGSGAINISANENGKYTKLTFTGDIGRYSDPLLKPPAVFQKADYIICESTYGDRIHDSEGNIESQILEIVKETCVERKGKVIIPAFSLGRTQEIVFVLDKLTNKGLLPPIPVYVDSPLSSKATDIVRQHTEAFNDELQAYLKKDPDPFGFPFLTYIEKAEDSRQLNEQDEPCVIISASGMADSGRIKHHLRYNISDPRNTVLISGYCSPRSLGGRLMRGAKEVHIFGDFFEVKAQVKSIQSLSAHADYEEMLRFLSCQNPSSVKSIFLVHGDDDVKLSFKEKLKDAGFKTVVIPGKGESFEL